jgi:Protein of unknown function (DUF2934)
MMLAGQDGLFSAPQGEILMAKKTTRTSGSATNSSVSEEERARMIAEAAYFRALQRGFQGGDPVNDWLEAERELTHAASASPAQRQA